MIVRVRIFKYQGGCRRCWGPCKTPWRVTFTTDHNLHWDNSYVTYEDAVDAVIRRLRKYRDHYAD